MPACVNKLNRNQKKFWSFVKLNKTENIGIPILSDTDGLHITDNAKAEALNRQFVSVFTDDDGNSLPDKGPSPFPDMDDINFTEPGIEKLLDNIKPSKAADPDELPARVLKEVSKEISGVLSMIFQQSHNAGHIPDDWSATRIYLQCTRRGTSQLRPTTTLYRSHVYSANSWNMWCVARWDLTWTTMTSYTKTSMVSIKGCLVRHN